MRKWFFSFRWSSCRGFYRNKTHCSLLSVQVCLEKLLHNRDLSCLWWLWLLRKYNSLDFQSWNVVVLKFIFTGRLETYSFNLWLDVHYSFWALPTSPTNTLHFIRFSKSTTCSLQTFTFSFRADFISHILRAMASSDTSELFRSWFAQHYWEFRCLQGNLNQIHIFWWGWEWVRVSGN